MQHLVTLWKAIPIIQDTTSVSRILESSYISSCKMDLDEKVFEFSACQRQGFPSTKGGKPVSNDLQSEMADKERKVVVALI